MPYLPPPAAARLLIHVEGARDANRRPLQSALRWLLALCSDRARVKERLLLDVQIDDLQGRRVLAIQGPGSLIDVPLPAGTYRVTANFGTVRRSYTLALEAGAPLELRLRLPTPAA